MLLTLLAVISVGTVLAREVFLDEKRIHRGVRIDGKRNECHLGHLLHDDSVVNGVVGILTP